MKDFGMIADILGDRMGCFLFQLPPPARLALLPAGESLSSFWRRLPQRVAPRIALSDRRGTRRSRASGGAASTDCSLL